MSPIHSGTTGCMVHAPPLLQGLFTLLEGLTGLETIDLSNAFNVFDTLFVEVMDVVHIDACVPLVGTLKGMTQGI